MLYQLLGKVLMSVPIKSVIGIIMKLNAQKVLSAEIWPETA